MSERQEITPEDRRIAAHLWLGKAIKAAMERGEDVAPAMDLFRALEGIEFGRVDAMFKLPEGQAVGRKEPPPGDVAIDALALATIDRLRELGWRNPLDIVAETLGLGEGSLRSLRKHVMRERAKRPLQRKRYVRLIEAYEHNAEMMANSDEGRVLAGLLNVAKGFVLK